MADHSKTKPYDLYCIRGAEVLHVEVKGTQTSGEDIILTAGEVEFATRWRCRARRADSSSAMENATSSSRGTWTKVR